MISYRPMPNVPEALPGTLALKQFQLNMESSLQNIFSLDQVQNAIENALRNVIVEPLKAWATGALIKGVILTEWGLIISCAIGIILVICKVNKGKDIAKVSAISFIAIQVIKAVVA